MRILELPAPLCPNGKLSIATLVRRGNYLATNYQVYLGENLGGGDPTNYNLLGAGAGFAQHGGLIVDYAADSRTIDLARGFVVILDGVDTILEEQTLSSGLANKLLCAIDDELLSVAGWELLGTDTYRVFPIRGRFGTARAAHAGGTEVHFVPLAALVPFQHPTFARGNTAVLKILALAPNRSQDLSDVDPESLLLEGTIFSLAAPARLAVNGQTRNASFRAADPLAITWLLPSASGLDLSRAVTLLEFLEADVVVHTQTVPWAGLSLSYAYPDPQPASFVLRASIQVDTEWETITGPAATLSVFHAEYA